MAGYRNFLTGEVLTAANVNDFLMEQSVMTFADAAARDAALAPVLREGMVAYLQDTDTPTYYDGSAWQEFTPSSLDASVITTGTFDAARIPNLDASKTTSGVFDIARIPNAAKAGIGSNVVQAVSTTTSASSSSTFGNIPNLSVTITPTSATSRVLLIASVNGAVSSGTNNQTLFRFAGGNAGNFIGDAAGSRSRVTFGFSLSGDNDSIKGSVRTLASTYLDSPGTTSAVTYTLQYRVTSGTAYLNRSWQDTDNNVHGRAASSLVAIEVAP